MTSATIKYLFVYGTLLRGHRTNESAFLMRGAEFVCEGSSPGSIVNCSKYPGAIFGDQSTGIVKGEIYRLPADPESLRKLDEYEEFNPRNPKQSLFVRKMIIVRTPDGRALECWAYELTSEQPTAQENNSL